MESESLDFTGPKIPRDYKKLLEEKYGWKNISRWINSF